MVREFFSEKTEHLFNHNHNGSYTDTMVQIIDFCNPNDQEKREACWMHKLRTLYPEGSNVKNK